MTPMHHQVKDVLKRGIRGAQFINAIQVEPVSTSMLKRGINKQPDYPAVMKFHAILGVDTANHSGTTRLSDTRSGYFSFMILT